MNGLVSTEWLAGALGAPDLRIVDVRWYLDPRKVGRDAYEGGHIPGAKNLAFSALVAADGTLRPRNELITLFQQAGIDLETPVVTSCGSGVTACALLLALEVVGHRTHAVYDGSWTEWGGRTDTPVAVGPDSVHLNQRGHDLIAQSLASWLVSAIRPETVASDAPA